MAVYFLIPKSDGTEEILSRRARSLHETELEIDLHDKTLLIREDVHEVQSNTEIITQGGTNSNSTALCYSGTDFISDLAILRVRYVKIPSHVVDPGSIFLTLFQPLNPIIIPKFQNSVESTILTKIYIQNDFSQRKSFKLLFLE